MSDPYRPNYYGNTYAPQEQYGEAPYPGNGYSQPSYQHQLQLSQSRYSPQPISSSNALGPPIPSVSYPIDDRDDTRSRSTHSHRRGDHGSRSRDASGSRASEHHRDSSRAKGIGATLVGAAGGGLLGHEIGGGALGTLGGALVGAIGANALEKRHERHKRSSSSDNRRDRDHSPGGLRGAISGFLDPHRGDERRSRSSAGERRRRNSRGTSVTEEEEVVIRRGGEKWR